MNFFFKDKEFFLFVTPFFYLVGFWLFFIGFGVAATYHGVTYYIRRRNERIFEDAREHMRDSILNQNYRTLYGEQEQQLPPPLVPQPTPPPSQQHANVESDGELFTNPIPIIDFDPNYTPVMTSEGEVTILSYY